MQNLFDAILKYNYKWPYNDLPVTCMLNKNSLAVKKVRGQSEATMAISDQNL